MKNTSLPIITIKRDAINNKDTLQLFFRYNDKLLSIIRTIKGFTWSKSQRCWHGPFSTTNLRKLKKAFGGLADIIEDDSIYTAPKLKRVKVNRQLSEQNLELSNEFRSYLKGMCYSQSTTNTYYLFVVDFLEYVNDKPIEGITNRDVEKFIEDVLVPRRLSISTHRQFISAMKVFKNFHPECKINEVDLKRPKKSKYLPTVLSQQEVLAILQCTKNLKHRAILALIYSCGLRVGELINLELKHIDILRNQLMIKNSKGRKDRYVNMADSLLPLIRNYIETYQPVRFFAEGKPKEKYTAGSIRAFLKKSAKLANITKNVTPHTLRHSYATHLLENGTDIRLIQTLLGHNKPETTMIYTHVSQRTLDSVNNPLDVAVQKFIGHKNNKDYLRIGPNVEGG